MNDALLEYEMKKAGVDTQAMCEALGISRSAFYRKRRGLSQFKLSEIEKIVEILHLESPIAIFFPEKVS